MTDDGRIRVLQVVASLNRGGIETWLAQTTQHISHERFALDVLVLSEKEGAYEKEILAQGCRVFRSSGASRPWRIPADFARVVREHGPYDIVHTHGYFFAGLVLYRAYNAGIRGRIAHSRNAHDVGKKAMLAWAPWRWLMRYCVNRYATHILAISEASAVYLLGPRLLKDPRYQILTTAIDLAPFGMTQNRDAMRSSLSIPEHSTVIGHVGNFSWLKNYDLLVDIAQALCERRDDVHFFLVGDGERRESIEKRVNALGISQHFTFAGFRSDVPALLNGAMDIFLMPSRFEGLGRVVVEAQAAGRPCVISSAIPPLADVIPQLINRVSLDEPVSAWVETLEQVIEEPETVTQKEALDIMQQSQFEIRQNVSSLENIYERAIAVQETTAE